MVGRFFHWDDHGPFRHTLAGHPLFSSERIVGLARESKNAEKGDGVLSVSRLEEEPAYREIFDACRHEITGAFPDLDGAPLHASLVIASPGAAFAPFVEPVSSFVLQVHGAQIVTIRAWDGAADSHYQLERHYLGHTVTGGADREASAGSSIRLETGQGAHQPEHALRSWAVTGDEPSLCVRIDLATRRAAREAETHRMNGLLRLAGVNARPAGRSAWLDEGKFLVGKAERGVRSVIERVRRRRQG